MTSSADAAIAIERVSHRYGERVALDQLDLRIEPGEIFVLLGPNGGGKTTLFRLVSTLIPLQHGVIRIFGDDVTLARAQARRHLGVAFQAPSLDKQLTVGENLACHGELYGMVGGLARARQVEVLALLGLADRAGERVSTLSGGLRRRVELAKALLPGPRLLLLDEPSTGLDPGARADLWLALQQLRAQRGVTVVMTTHLLDEAEKSDRLAILDRGRLVALDTPERLRATIGGESLTIESSDAERLAHDIEQRFGLAPRRVEGSLRLELPDAVDWLRKLASEFSSRMTSITLGKPTLEDVFIARTGHRFYGADDGKRPDAAG